MKSNGLVEIIVGAGIEARHAVVHGVARGEHQDGRAKSARAQLTANGVAVLQRQHHIENYQIVLMHGSVVDGLLAVGGDSTA